jgi:hypothetical protein
MGGRLSRKRIPLRRIITAVCVLLLLGAIVNVAVALVFATFADLDSAFPRTSTHSEVDKFLYLQWREQPGGRELRIVHADGRLAKVTNLAIAIHPATPSLKVPPAAIPSWVTRSWRCMRGEDEFQRVILQAWGWPAFALGSRPDPGHTIRLSGPVYPRFQDNRRWQPLWPGFAINALFYAAVLWLLFAAPFALRRRRRIKRGLCPACAYPVGASDACTECGKPLPRLKSCNHAPHGNLSTAGSLSHRK